MITGTVRDPNVAKLIEQLKNPDSKLRRSAVHELGESGGPSVIAALIGALKDTNHDVREEAAGSLGEIGDSAAVSALVATLQDEHKDVRRSAADALGIITYASGDAVAASGLIEALEDEDPIVRRSAARALSFIGDSETLPRHILAESRFSPQERIDILERLRGVRYALEDLLGHKSTLRYLFSDTLTLCRAVIQEDNVAARKGAQEVLDALALLRGSQPDPSKQTEELLRPAPGREP